MAAPAAPARLALVIGNAGYGGDAPLPNARNDATLMAATLTRLGFAVTAKLDLSKAQFVKAVADFTEAIPPGATALVYYAGHGMQIGGNNYLNPVDMTLTSEQAAPLRAYPLKALLDRLALSKSAVNIVVLDACRNNPFRLPGPARYRGQGALGLTPVAAPRGTLIAYSTAPGQLAPDGAGSNSLYTRTLARALPEAGRDIEALFKQVASEVRRASLDDQIPWYESSITERFYFAPGPGQAVTVAATAAAGAGVGAGASAPRGATTEAPWFRHATASQWSEIDWEISQRVKHMTPDELAVFERKARGGNVVAQTTLGLAYRAGLDKAADPASGRTLRFKANNTLARKWLGMAAAAGFPVAQVELGEMLYAGHGIDRDVQQSRKWFEKAAEADYPRAQLNLLQLRLQEASQGGAGQALDPARLLQNFPFLKPPKN